MRWTAISGRGLRSDGVGTVKYVVRLPNEVLSLSALEPGALRGVYGYGRITNVKNNRNERWGIGAHLCLMRLIENAKKWI